ncbi:hypothetical protein [Methylorubrum suomiense]|uniref:C1q domain-containing protein n=1 Tax=Methylorubrum suomiense TaxID=144191 RepID=A0ABQ4UZI6_9HYPH|nr:hypothetical protein [Methylorubrum suomiense]GJE77299.1 hypothetical protein BGCPKDLD_3902 [Methylorubrum suomiense]
MPEFRLVPEIDGVPTSIRPTDARFGAAVGAAPVVADGVPDTIANHLEGKASLDPDTGKVLQAQIDLSKGGDYGVGLGLPAIATVQKRILSRGFIQASVDLGITGATSGSVPDETTKWLAAIADALPTLAKPVLLPGGRSYRIGRKLTFPSGTGIVSDGGVTILGDAGDFNNTSRGGGATFVGDIGTFTGARFGSNAVMVAAADNSVGVTFRGLKLQFTAASASTFVNKAVIGLLANGVKGLVVEDVEATGFNNGGVFWIDACKDFLIRRANIHDCVLHATTPAKGTHQLTGIWFDEGDHDLSISTGILDRPVVRRLLLTDAVASVIGYESDAWTVGGRASAITIIAPLVSSCGECDYFGGVRVLGGLYEDMHNFGFKLVHGARGAYATGLKMRRIGLAAVTLQSGQNEVQSVSGNFVQAEATRVGEIAMEGTTVNGVTVAPRTTKVGSASNFAGILALDVSTGGAAGLVENNTVEVTLSDSPRCNVPAYVGTTGAGNAFRVLRADDSMTGRMNLLSGNGAAQTMMIGEKTAVSAYLTADQSIPASTTTVIGFNAVSVDAKGEMDTSTSAFTASKPGTYRFVLAGQINDIDGTKVVALACRRAGAVFRQSVRKNTGTAGGPVELAWTVDVPLSTGQTVDFTINQSCNTEKLLAGTSQFTTLYVGAAT